MQRKQQQGQEFDERQQSEGYREFAGQSYEYRARSRQQGGAYRVSPEQSYEYQSQQSFYQRGYEGASYEQPRPLVSAAPMDDAKLAAVLSYSLAWFTGLLFALFSGQNRYVRFHALQSLLFFGAVNVLDIALLYAMARAAHLHGFPSLFLFALLLFFLLNCVAFVAWIIGMIQAGRGVYYKLPVVGDVVARSVRWPTLPKTEG